MFSLMNTLCLNPTLRQGFASLIEKKMGVKDKMMVYGDDSERVKTIPTERGFQNRFKAG